MLCVCVYVWGDNVFKGYGGVLFFTLIDDSLPIWFFKLYLFIFGCAGAWLLHRTSSSRSEWGRPSMCAVQAPYCGDSSCRRAQALERTGSVAVARGPRCPLACEIFLDQRSSPHSVLALAGTLLTTGPTGKLQGGVLFCFFKALFAKWLLRFVDVSEVDTEI